MPQPHSRSMSTANSRHVGRTGLASYLFVLLRPRDAKAARLNTEVLMLKRVLGSMVIPFKDIDTAQITIGWFWGSLRVRYASGEVIISGLSKLDALAFTDALDNAIIGWWLRTLAAHIRTIRSVYDRLSQLADPPRYMARSVFSVLERDARDAVAQFPSGWPDKLSDTTEIGMLKAIQDFLNESQSFRAKACETFVVNELARSKGYFDRIEAKPLTDEQRKAVVVDEDHNLVVAAAGSGKTSVIVAKAGWLLKKGYRLPSELLLLAFAKDAQKEMEERVRSRLGNQAGTELTVRTFHSLGMSIIGEVERKRPALARVAEDDKALCDLLREIIADLVADPKYSKVMLRWFEEHFAPYQSEYEFKTQGEYWAYLRANEIRALQGEMLKSYEECEIANFLYLHGVPYKYECDYEHETATPKKRQYQPDFYVSDAGIYIEHLALSASGDTPPFIDSREYLRSLEWKRRLHAQHGTVLIETYSHEHAAGKLIENLASKLSDHGVALSPIPSEEVFTVLEQQGRIDPFTRLVATFLHHYKGAQLSAAEVADRAARASTRPRAEAFLTVFMPVFERYQESLARLRKIDFHDMINKATEHVESGRYQNRFGYILVDEFQDISPDRARLLKALLNTSNSAQLFAVGDDWQAIYRFAGSDIAIMRDFRAHFGESEYINIETTFRCADRLADLATRFVLSNPLQIRKNVSSIFHADEPCIHVIVVGEECPDPLDEALKEIAAHVDVEERNLTVLILGRYNHSKPKNMSVLEREYSDLHLSFMTVHRSKGLEADYVVMLDLCAGTYGFPSEIVDDPLLNLVLAESERHPYAEERRLFYVAITRARCGVYLLTDGGPPSSFVTELINDGYDVTVFGTQQEQDAACPRCTTGRVVRRKNARDQGTFYGCSHWPYCEHTQSACPHCGSGLPVKVDGAYSCRGCGQHVEECPACDGWLKTKSGKNGWFLGCSKWPTCGYTRDVAGPNMAKLTRERSLPGIDQPPA